LVRAAALLLACTTQIVAYVGDRFVLTGVEAADRDKPAVLVPETRLAAGDSSDLEELAAEADRIAAVLADSGFLSAQVSVDTARADGGVLVAFVVCRGPRSRIREWQFAGPDSLPEAVLRRVLPRRVPYTRPVALRAVAAAREVMVETANHPLAELAIAALVDSAGWVTPVLAVRAGPTPNVRFLACRPALVSERLLSSLARFSPGLYSGRRVAAWRRNVESYGFAQVDSVAAVSAGSDTGVLFTVRRLRASEATGAAAYSAEQRQLSGFARVSIGNLFETGRSLAGEWRSGYGDTRYSLVYLEPVVLRGPADLEIGVSHRSLDTSFADTRAFARVTIIGPRLVRVGLETGVERIVDVARKERLDATWAGTILAYDGLDGRLNPSRGVAASAATRVGLRDSDSAAARLIDRTELDFEVAAPLVGRLVGWFGSSARTVYSPDELLEPELYPLGGAGSLRGYRQDQFLSRTIGWASFEPRFLLGRLSRAYPFIEAGAYAADGRIRFLGAWGVGARLAAGVGQFGIDYGVAFGASPLTGKLHFNLRVAF
jgi:outer membrane protein assembly factor BamA